MMKLFLTDESAVDQYESQLYQSPSAKFNYRVIERFSIDVNKICQRQIKRFCQQQHKISFLISHKILWREFHKNSLKTLIFYKIKKFGLDEFLSEFSDKREFKSFVQILASQFDHECVKHLVLWGNCRFLYFGGFCSNKWSCQEFFQMFLEYFGEDFIKELMSKLLKAICIHGDQLALIGFLQILKCDKSFLKNVINLKDARLLHSFWLCDRNSNFIKLIKILINNLGKKFVEQFLMAPGIKGEAFLHIFCSKLNRKGITELLQYLVGVFDQKYIKKLFTLKNSQGSTFLHCLRLGHHNKEIGEFYNILLAFHWKFNKKLLKAQNKRGDTFMHNFLEHPLGYHSLYALDQLFTHFSRNINIKLLLTRNNEGNTSVFDLSKSHFGVTFQDFQDAYTQYFGKRSIMQLLLMQNNKGQTILYSFESFRKGITFVELMKSLIDDFGLNFCKKMMTLKSEFDSTIAVQILTSSPELFNCQETPFLEFYESLRNNFDSEMVEIIIKSKSAFGDTLLHQYAKYSENFDLEECIQVLLKDFGGELVKDMLLARNSLQSSVLNDVSKCQSIFDLVKLIQTLKIYLNEDSIKTLLLMQNNSLASILHILAWYSEEIFEDITRYMIDNFETEFLRELFSLGDMYDATFLHNLATYNKATNFIDLLKLLITHLSKQFVVSLLQIRGNENNLNVFELLGICNDTVVLKELFKILD